MLKIPQNTLADFSCSIDTSTGYESLVKHPKYWFIEWVTIFHQSLNNQLANQINNLIAQINTAAKDEEQAHLMLLKFFQNGYFSAITNCIEDYRNYSMESLFPAEFFPDFKFITYKKYSFCEENPRAMTSDPYEFIFRTMFFSICSWKISEETPLLDQKKFFITIIFSVFDQWEQKYFEVKLHVATPSWIAQECKKQPLTFFRHILIQEYFDLDIIKHHIYRTLIHSIPQDNPRFYSSAVHELGFGFELPEEYEEIGQSY